MIVPKEVGQRLKQLRISQELTQEQLAAILYISSIHVYKMENGSRMPSIDLCLMICKYFNVSTDYLLTGKSQEDSPKEILHRIMRDLSKLDKQFK